MTRGGKPRPLGEIMKELIETLGSSSRFGEAAIVAAWQDVSGPQVQQVTESVWVDKGKLFVKLSSPSWRQELHLQRRAWCDRLNRELGKDVVEEIVFR